MSWIQKLIQTYDNCQAMIGVEEGPTQVPLLPISHTTQMAQIEIVIDGQGNYRRARVVPKPEARTIIPCTEKSGGRTSGEAAHPLCDKLQYIAKDYPVHGGSKDSYFNSYCSQLETWAGSKYAHPKLTAILQYVKKGHIVGDLIDNLVLIASQNGLLLKKADLEKSDPVPKIFEVLTSQEDAFVRWIVEIPNDLESRMWRDGVIWDLWIQYYLSTKTNQNLCYVRGIDDFTADQHLAKIRNDGDKAKLISSNDQSGFTFLGRFLSSDQATTIGYEASQKAHLALRWLISRQGYRKGDLAVVAWATTGTPIPKPTDDLFSILGFDDMSPDEPLTAATAQELSIKLKHKIAGYSEELGDVTNIVVMSLDSASPGRMAIIYYRELRGSDFIQRIENWHETCSWIHQYRSKKFTDPKTGKDKSVWLPFIGAPSPNDIAEAAFGMRIDDKLRKSTVARILPCIIDGEQIPRDLVVSTVRRACNRIGMDDWEWNKTLSIACALFNQFNGKENYSMTLDPERKTRDYLYGRLLALAESIEGWALNEARENRQTNAARLMQRFAEHPFSTWRTIELSLTPYKARLGGKSTKRQRMIDEVIDLFDEEDFLSDKPLSGEFLLGYHSQREYLRNPVNLDQTLELEES